MNYNDRDDTDMNANLQNGDVSSGISLLNSHTLTQCNKSINLNDMNMSVENGDVYGVNSSTGSESKNHNCIYYTNKSDKMSPNRSELEIMDYRMVLALMLYCLHLHLINIPICNTTINIVNF